MGEPHPDPIVETSSLSAVQPPEPTYDLKIGENLEISKALSCLQIEAVIYACQVFYYLSNTVSWVFSFNKLNKVVLINDLCMNGQRHLHHLPSSSRAGFFIGDGAGVGKGRTIAGLIWENWQHGRHKAL